MVERRMTSAIQQVGAFWYSAWVEAGQPDLKNIGKVTIDEAPINTENKKIWEEKNFKSTGLDTI